MQRQRTAVQDNQQGVEPLDAVNAVGKHHGAAGVLEEEVVEVEVLLLLLTLDFGLRQGLGGRLLPRQVNDFGLGLDAHFLHEGFQPVPLVQILPLEEAGGKAASHGQRGREHKGLPRRVEVRAVQHLQQTLQFGKVAPLNHAICFINDQAPGKQNYICIKIHHNGIFLPAGI